MRISPKVVYVVDNDPDFGEGLDALFRAAGFQPQSFRTGYAFLDTYPGLPPGCLFVGLDIPDMSGIEFMRRLKAGGCHWPVVIVAGQGSAMSAADAVREGAFGFLEKPLRELEALATATRAHAYLNFEAKTPYDEDIAERIQHLSRREREVFDYVLQGLLNKQIAAQLGIAESTVKSARRALMERMHADTSLELVAMALRGGMTIKNRS